jgi:predicted DNA binding protein
MTGISAVIRIEHPDIVLTETVTRDSSANVRSVSEAGTDPSSGRFFYHVESAALDRFDEGLEGDPTIGDFERVIEIDDGQAIYRFEYTDSAKILSPIISAANGVILEMANEGRSWVLTVWMAERANLDHLWEYAERHDIDIELLRLNEYGRLGAAGVGVTDSQGDALRVAFEMGYFEEPRSATLSEVATALDVSQPAAGGLIRRGTKRLVESCLLGESEDAD